MENDVTEMGVFICQCQLCRAQLQLTCGSSSEVEQSSISEATGVYNDDQECIKETTGLVQSLLESNNERLAGM